ncbi:hypothetical protein [Haladaptatus sp. NG-SE-30]
MGVVTISSTLFHIPGVRAGELPRSDEKIREKRGRDSVFPGGEFVTIPTERRFVDDTEVELEIEFIRSVEFIVQRGDIELGREPVGQQLTVLVVVDEKEDASIGCLCTTTRRPKFAHRRSTPNIFRPSVGAYRTVTRSV